MAANLSNNLSDITKVTVFMDECKRMGLSVLAPDVNESYNDFTVNSHGQIRFGMAAIKGVGEAAVEKSSKNGRKTDLIKMYTISSNESTINRSIRKQSKTWLLPADWTVSDTTGPNTCTW